MKEITYTHRITQCKYCPYCVLIDRNSVTAYYCEDLGLYLYDVGVINEDCKQKDAK